MAGEQIEEAGDEASTTEEAGDEASTTHAGDDIDDLLRTYAEAAGESDGSWLAGDLETVMMAEEAQADDLADVEDPVILQAEARQLSRIVAAEVTVSWFTDICGFHEFVDLVALTKLSGSCIGSAS